MQEELTTEMHAEFTVSPEEDERLRAFVAIDVMKDMGYSIEKVSVMYRVSKEVIQKYIPEYDALDAMSEED